jgi:tetratricopeptide (TPR) repeat protein
MSRLPTTASARVAPRRGRDAFAFAVLLAAACFASMAEAADTVDYVALGAQLVRDGHYDRAAETLKKVDASAEGVDLVTFHTARGMVALEQQQPEAAAQAFGEAIAAGQTDPMIHLYRAQALFALERYVDALAALDAAGEGVEAISGGWLMRAHAQWLLGRRQAALDTLGRAAARFPGNTQFQRRQVFYLVEAGLHQQAADLGRDYLRRTEGKAADYAAIGTALRQGKSFEEALRFLESAALKFPDDGSVAKALAQTWLARGDVLAAAEVLGRQAEREPALLPEAAELFRRAGQRVRALTLNARIVDQPRKLKQRVGLLLELRRYDQVAGMEDALYRVGLLDDEDVRYALAYAHYRSGDFVATEKHLTALKRPELFRKATELRRLMQECGDARWTCA